jgi:uncharacterized protein (UPF0276 family)
MGWPQVRVRFETRPVPGAVLTWPEDIAMASTEDPLAMLPRLGVGAIYNPALPNFLRTSLASLDFLAIIPDRFRTDHGNGASPRFIGMEDMIGLLDWVAERRPVIAHSIGLSIGSAGLLDVSYVEELARWQHRYGFPWHSEHLSFSRIPDAHGADHNTNLTLPLPYDKEALDLVVERVLKVKSMVPVPLLLENNVYFTELPEQEMDEPDFLNRLTAASGCGLLLDLHNVYTNARNFGFDALEFLGRIDLSRVVEIHVAGGEVVAGMYTDSHAGGCPDEVWSMLDTIAPNLPNLCAVTFEFHESSYGLLEDDGIREQLNRARDIWSRHVPARTVVVT